MCLFYPTSYHRQRNAPHVQVLRAAVTKFFPEADGEMRHACVCVFTNTPDSHFIIDKHPDHPQARLSSSEI